MSIVTIDLGSKKFKLSCSEESKDHLVTLAEKLDFELSAMQKASPAASFELLLVMTALGLMDDKQSKLAATGGEILEKANQESQAMLSAISSELEIVAKKFKKD